MTVYITTTTSHSFTGGWFQCLAWAQQQVSASSDTVVKFHLARAGEKTATVVAEATTEGLRIIPNGRKIPLRKLQSGQSHGS